MIKLHIGCGDVILPGWINLDAVPGPRIDIGDDARTLSAVPDQSVDIIYASHILDHIGRHDVVSALEAWGRKLVPGGVLRLAVSDFGAVVEKYLSGKPLRTLLGHIVGGHKGEFDAHGIVFDRRLLVETLIEAGFSDVRDWNWRDTDHAGYDDFSQAYEPHMQKDTGRLMSLNLEASWPGAHEVEPPEYSVIGDSHSWVFTNTHSHPGLFEAGRAVRCGRFLVNRMGPWLAESLDRRAGLVLDEARKVPTSTKIILSFGEIDGRCIVVPRVKASGRKLVDVCREVVEPYLATVNGLRDLGYDVYTWNAPPQTGGPCWNPEYPIRGTYEECRGAVECINSILAEKTKHISIYRHLVHEQRTNTSLFLDHIHLDPRRVWKYIEEVIP